MAGTDRSSVSRDTGRDTATSKSGRITKSGRSSGTRAPPPPSSYSREVFDLYCWGYGGNGALGNSAFRDEHTPYLVEELRACGGTVLVACGFDHTVAVCGDLKARAWGRNSEGQLGVSVDQAEAIVTPRTWWAGAAESREDGTEQAVKGGASVVAPRMVSICEGADAVSISGVACGGMHTALLTQPRTKGDLPLVFSMGRGNEGQLGLGLEGVADRVESARQARDRARTDGRAGPGRAGLLRAHCWDVAGWRAAPASPTLLLA